jgi:hypothetical protein
MSISQQIAGPINSILSTFFADTGLTKTVQLIKHGTITWSDALQQNVTTESTINVSAIQLRHTQRSVAASPQSVGIQVGDRVYMIRQSGLDANSKPTPQDMIGDDGQVMEIKDVNIVFSFFYLVTVEGS